MIRGGRGSLGFVLALVGALSGCGVSQPALTGEAGAPPAQPSAEPTGMVREGTPDSVNIAKARSLAREQLFSWHDWSQETFAKAKAEKRFILFHGAAEWCHWCHVMEETTYRHPEVGAILRERFIAIRVDVDSRPDLEERYDEWGWPATVILDSEAREIAKFRGYIPPEDMLEVLADVQAGAPAEDEVLSPLEPLPPLEALAWIGANSSRRLDSYYDPEGGSWGFRQKAPIGDNVTFELRRFERGQSQTARDRALFSARQHARLIDPIWGGIYQYSTHGDWEHIHFEKLMTYQAANLTAFAEAHRITGDAEMLAHARAIERYMNTFLSNDDGAFLVTQDADVNAHERDKPFVDGHVYYALDDAGRRKLGIPRVDANVYAEENGLAIAALAALYEATGDPRVLARARRAADLVLSKHVDAEGRVKHDAESPREVFYLADGASLGYALARLAEVAPESGASYLAAADRIAAWMVRDLLDPADGALLGHTPDPDATGVFSQRRKPYMGNVNAARLLAALGRLQGDASKQARARSILRGISLPEVLRNRGRMIGTYLLALDEAGALAWPGEAPVETTPAAPSQPSAPSAAAAPTTL